MSDNAETAVLAGGCFWIMQQLLFDRDGVISTRVGWTGGENDNPTEENNSGHAEAVEVVFDPERISYRDLLEFFFQVHRPDLGENLVGFAYRSEIFLRPTSSARWPRRRSSTSTPQVTGPARWSPGSTKPVASGRPRAKIRATSNAIRMTASPLFRGAVSSRRP